MPRSSASRRTCRSASSPATLPRTATRIEIVEADVMQPTITEGQFRPEFRLRICTKCPLRPRHGVKAHPDMPQRCEATCPLFQKLGELVRRAALLDPMLCSRERVLGHLI